MKSKEFSPDQWIKLSRLLRKDGVCVIREVKNDRLVLEHEKIRIATGDGFGEQCFSKVTVLIDVSKRYLKLIENYESMNIIQRFFLWMSGMNSQLKLKQLDD